MANPRLEQYQDIIARLYPNFNHIEKNQIQTFTCTFSVTDDCNLRCSYCYQINKGHHVMTFDTAKRILLSEFTFVQASPDFDEIEIEVEEDKEEALCPLCGEPLDEEGECPECGWTEDYDGDGELCPNCEKLIIEEDGIKKCPHCDWDERDDWDQDQWNEYYGR